MSWLNSEDNHKGLSHPALLEILKTAARRAQNTYSSASAEMSRQNFGEGRVATCFSQAYAARADKGTRARLTWHDQVHQWWVQRCREKTWSRQTGLSNRDASYWCRHQQSPAKATALAQPQLRLQMKPLETWQDDPRHMEGCSWKCLAPRLKESPSLTLLPPLRPAHVLGICPKTERL